MSKLTINAVINSLYVLAHTSEELYLCYDVHKDESLQKLSFEKADELINHLDEKIQVITHEISSEVRFKLQTIEKIQKYAAFRQKYKHWSHAELGEIVDGHTIVHVLKNYLDKNSIQEEKARQKVSWEIKAIRSEWKELFTNETYQELTNEILFSKNL